MHDHAIPALLTALVCSSLVAIMVPAAHAWKPRTHVYLSELAAADALDDGKVTIYATDYANGGIKTSVVFGPIIIGRYEVDPAIVSALRNNPAQFRSGAFGPDAYPDIATGQQIIHPAGGNTPGPDVNQGGPGPDPWLQQLYQAAQASPSPAVKAFTLGFLSHAAGDVFAHTFINQFSGAPFHITPTPANAIKHMVLEGYIEKRTPTLASYDATLGADVEEFIYRQMVDARAGTVLETTLLQGDNKKFSVPHLYSRLRRGLQGYLDRYDAKLKAYDGRLAALESKALGYERQADDCDWWDAFCWGHYMFLAAEQRLDKIGPRAERAAYVVLHAIPHGYTVRWVDDIDAGLRAWPGVSQRVAAALFFRSSGGADFEAAHAEIETWWREHGLSMTGFPDWVGVVSGALDDLLGFLGPVADALDALYERLWDWLLEQAYGMNVDELKQYVRNPEVYFDAVMNSDEFNPDNGQKVTLEAMNRDFLHLADPGYSTPGETFDYRRFAPAYNTVVMTKLLLMKRSEVQRLLKDLGSSVVFSGDNAMLGFAASLDDGNQFVKNAQQMVVARDCGVYQCVFMKQAGETVGALCPNQFCDCWWSDTVRMDWPAAALPTVNVQPGSPIDMGFDLGTLTAADVRWSLDTPQLPGANPLLFQSGDGTSATLRWMPTTADTGDFDIVVRADGSALMPPDEGREGSRPLPREWFAGAVALKLRVTAVDHPPVITAPAFASAAEGGLLLVPISVDDADGHSVEVLAADLSDLPGAAFSVAPDRRSGLLSWEPASSDSGEHRVTFVARNQLADTVTTTIHISNVDRPPVFTGSPTEVMATAGRLLTVPIQLQDPDGDAMQWLRVDFSNLPSGREAQFAPDSVGSGGLISWIPSLADTGLRPLALRGASGLERTMQLMVQVTASEGSPPRLDVPERVGGQPGDSIKIEAVISDPEPGVSSAIAASLDELPGGSDATFTLAPDSTRGTLRWRASEPGSYRVRFAARNRLTAVRTCTIQISRDEPPDPPKLPAGMKSADRRLDLRVMSPNPARTFVTLAYQLPQDGRARLTVHDVSGRRVAVLADGVHQGGAHQLTWWVVDSSGRRVPPGVLYARLDTPWGRVTRRLVLVP